MQSPLFYTPEPGIIGQELQLDENSSRHAIQVLRMQTGNSLQLTDGKGKLYTTQITSDHRKHCKVQVQHIQTTPRQGAEVILAISPLKNTGRFEWMLEKVTELGVTAVIPLVCSRTEKQQLRIDRLQGIMVSALLQSQQYWLPELCTPVQFEKFNWSQYKHAACYFAHCMQGEKRSLLAALDANRPKRLIMVGPEGDFTTNELETALQQGCVPVTLGDTRLRTETAGLVAVVLASTQKREENGTMA